MSSNDDNENENENDKTLITLNHLKPNKIAKTSRKYN